MASNEDVSKIFGDAEEYVESIMSTQSVTSSEHLSKSNRKRHLSLPETADGTPKKMKNDSSTGRVIATAHRTLYGHTPSSKAGSDREQEAGGKSIGKGNMDVIMQKLDTISSEIKSVNEALSKRITDEVKAVNDSLSNRLNQLETELEKKLSDRLAQLLDKRVNSEMKRVTKVIDEKIDTFRADINSELEEITGRVNSLADTIQTDSGVEDRSLNIVIRKLPSSGEENIQAKVNSLISNQLQLPDVSVSTAHRIINDRNRGNPGVVIATMKSKADKAKVMRAKSKLKGSQTSNVFIHHDQSKEERKMTSNLHAIVDAINARGRASVRGSRVFCDRNSSGYANNAVQSDRSQSSTDRAGYSGGPNRNNGGNGHFSGFSRGSQRGNGHRGNGYRGGRRR